VATTFTPDRTNLTYLDLKDTNVTDAGLKELKHLKNLEELNLVGTKVTDAGMKELKNIKHEWHFQQFLVFIFSTLRSS
jgi:Leucine-rich repeat (LRR) protein